MATDKLPLKEALAKAAANHYGIPMVNSYNLEWTKAIIFSAQQANAPVMVGVNHEAATYMGGYESVVALVKSLVKANDITVPVYVHLDHGNEQACILALEAGFDSIMFDGSSLPFEQNFTISKRIMDLASRQGACFEAEVGTIGGKEDSVKAGVSFADVNECVTMAELGVDMLAVGIGNAHGHYPDGWQGLNFELLAEISAATDRTPLVLHGSSWIPAEQIRKAIGYRISKINVSSELKDAFAKATVAYVEGGKANGKGLDPRRLLGPGYEAIKSLLVEKFALFGATNRA